MFAAAADAAGTESVRLEQEVSTVAELREALVSTFGPEFERVLTQCSLLAGGHRIESGRLPAGRVDVLPPFAGG